MKLYHGTGEAVARKALVEGLRPRAVTGSKGNWEHTVPSDSGNVYLTTAYAGYFAAMAQEGTLGVWGIVEVDTDLMDEYLLVPDEDYMEQSTRGQDLSQVAEMLGDESDAWKGSMEERTTWFGANSRLFGHLWQKSVLGLGNCAYAGTIPAEAITRVGLFKPSDNPAVTGAMDPMIILINYQLMGDSYRAMSRWLVGDDIGLAEFYGSLRWEGIRRMVPEKQLAEVADLLSTHAGLEVLSPKR